jgi:hypothetical protein
MSFFMTFSEYINFINSLNEKTLFACISKRLNAKGNPNHDDSIDFAAKKTCLDFTGG